MKKNIKIKNTRDVMINSGVFIRGRVLDAGGGDSKYKAIIKESAAEYICLDIKPGDNVDVVGDVLNMPFQDGYFDTVISNQVLEHIKEPEKLFSETYRVLKSGGYFICTAPFLEPNHSDPEDYFRYTKEALGLMAQRHKFKIVKNGAYGGWPTVIFSFIRFKLFNPYKKHPRIKRAILRRLTRLFDFLDEHSSLGIVYCDSFLIAQK